MSEAVWDGITRAETLTASAAATRHQLADAAKAYDWGTVLALLAQHSELVNSTRPGVSSLYTVLHQAAHGGAPADVVEKLLALGAWRTLRNAERERPVDIAKRREQAQLVPLLEPVLHHGKEQHHVHAAAICSRQ